MADTMDAVDNMFDQDYSSFRNNVNDILFNKLQDRISVEKISIGQSMFEDEIDVEPETELQYDEDDTDEEV